MEKCLRKLLNKTRWEDVGFPKKITLTFLVSHIGTRQMSRRHHQRSAARSRTNATRVYGK